MYKKAQEEIVGFGIIIIIVAIIFVVVLAFMLSNNPERNVQSEEVNGYINSILQYTTDCEDYLEFKSIEKLISGCLRQDSCIDGREMCLVLNETITSISDSSWRVGAETPIKAYKFEIFDKEEKERLSIKKGNETKNSKSAMQNFHHSDVIFSVYY